MSSRKRKGRTVPRSSGQFTAGVWTVDEVLHYQPTLTQEQAQAVAEKANRDRTTWVGLRQMAAEAATEAAKPAPAKKPRKNKVVRLAGIQFEFVDPVGGKR